MNELPNNNVSELISILKEFTNFLEPYKQLLDTHNIQFILTIIRVIKLRSIITIINVIIYSHHNNNY